MKKFRCIFCKNKKLNYNNYEYSDQFQDLNSHDFVLKFCKKCNIKFWIWEDKKNYNNPWNVPGKELSKHKHSNILVIEYYLNINNDNSKVIINYPHFNFNV